MKKAIIILTFLNLSIVYSFSQNNVELEDKMLKTTTLGDLFFNNKNYSEAIKKYSESLKEQPENSYLHYKMGIANYFLEKDSLALVHLKKAYSLNSSISSDIRYFLAESYHNNGYFKESNNLFNSELSEFEKTSSDSTYIEILKKLILETSSGMNFTENIDTMIIIQNLGKSINTENTEFGSLFIADSMLFFTSIRPEKKLITEYEDIFYSVKQKNIWSENKKINKPINTDFSDIFLYYFEKEQKIYLSATINRGDIFYSEFKNNKWTQPKSIEEGINSSFTESSICFSHDGDTAYFVSNRPTSKGGKDIFWSVRKDNIWQSPVNLDVTNTVYDEESVFLIHDTLYFASQGHNSVGGFDIFRTIKQIDGTWCKPENLGLPINSPFDDLFFTKNKKMAFLSSNRKESYGKMDIFEIEKLKISEQSKDSLIASNEIEISEKDTLTAKNEELKEFSISEILFNMNEFENKEEFENLDNLISFLKLETSTKLQILGFTDTQGGEKYNQILSQKRANFVKNYILSKGIEADRVLAIGKGESSQIAKNQDFNGNYDKLALKYNRRVEFYISGETLKTKLTIKKIEVPDNLKVRQN